LTSEKLWTSTRRTGRGRRTKYKDEKGNGEKKKRREYGIEAYAE